MKLIVSTLFYAFTLTGWTQIAEAFGINVQALKRWVKGFREKGSNTFYRPPETRGNPTVLTPEVRTKAQLLLDTGASVSETARELDIGYDTVRKAIADGQRTTRPGPAVRRSQLL